MLKISRESEINLINVLIDHDIISGKDLPNIKKLSSDGNKSQIDAVFELKLTDENKILNENGLRHRHEFVGHKILDCLGDLMLTGHRIFGHIKTSQGGHQLTNLLLREFLSNKSNLAIVSNSV